MIPFAEMLDPEIALALVVVALCVALLVVVAGWLAARNADDRRLAGQIARLGRDAVVLPAYGGAPRSMSAEGILRAIGSMLSNTALLSETDRRDLERSIAAAGYRPGRVVPLVVGAKVILLLLLPLVLYAGAWLLGARTQSQLMLAGIGLVFGLLGPNWVLGWLHRRYVRQIRNGLADTLDLMVICAEAGLGLETMVERVAQEMAPTNGPIASEFTTLSYELRILSDRRQALVNLGDRTEIAGLRRLGGTLAQTIQYGTPLGQALRTLAAEMRYERLTEFEERAARLPALLVLPLTLFILPCLVLLLAGPSFVQLIDAFSR